MRSVLYFWKSQRNGCYRLWRAYISEDQSIYQTVVLPTLRYLLLSTKLYRRMTVFTCILISALMTQKLFWILFGFSLARVAVVTFSLTTLLWLYLVWGEIMNDGLWTTCRRVWK